MHDLPAKHEIHKTGFESDSSKSTGSRSHLKSVLDDPWISSSHGKLAPCWHKSKQHHWTLILHHAASRLSYLIHNDHWRLSVLSKLLVRIRRSIRYPASLRRVGKRKVVEVCQQSRNEQRSKTRKNSKESNSCCHVRWFPASKWYDGRQWQHRVLHLKSTDG